MRILKAVPGLLLATIWTTSATAGPVTTNLVLWLDASNGLAADGSTWTDLSGNNHNATALPGQAPTVVPNAINGLTAALFSGDQAMSIAGQVLTDPQNYTIIALVTDPTDSNSSNTGFREIFSNWDPTNETTSTFLGDTGVNPQCSFYRRSRRSNR